MFLGWLDVLALDEWFLAEISFEQRALDVRSKDEIFSVAAVLSHGYRQPVGQPDSLTLTGYLHDGRRFAPAIAQDKLSLISTLYLYKHRPSNG